MTQAKKLKKAVRARSRKTGESYAAARRQVLAARQKRSQRPAPELVAAPLPAAMGRSKPQKAGLNDANVVKKTGHGFEHWFSVLDAFGAKEKGHTASAEHLYEAHGVPGWHAQMITVAYERERGIRALNQRCDGSFEVSVSRTLPADATDVVDAIGNARRREAWLEGADPDLARALNAAFEGPKARKVTIANKSYCYARLRYPWDGAAVDILITKKPKGGSSIVAANHGLPDAGLVEKRRRLWRAALGSLQAHLAR
jgi:hypothetical protein